MFGPMPAGTSVRAGTRGAYPPLLPGRRYRVVQAFADYDQGTHPLGETWTFLGHNFLPYDDGLSLFVSLDGVQEWHIRMQLRAGQQEAVMDAFAAYVTELP